MHWCYWQHFWHHRMPTLVPVVSVSKTVSAPHFNHLHMRKAVVPQMMPSASSDTHANTSGITWPKIHVGPDISCLTLRNAKNNAIDYDFGIMWHLCHCHWHQMTKSHVTPHLNFLELRNSWMLLTILLASHDFRVVPVVSHDQKVMLYLIWIILT